MRLIDVDAFKNDYCMADECKDCQTPVRTCEYDRVYTKMDFCEWLDSAPTVQPERKKGKWIYNSPVTMKCDQCGLIIKDWDWNRFKFCPNCDCDMRGEQDEE